MITYTHGGIIIPLTLLSGAAPQINPEAVQHRLSKEDFEHFWERMRIKVGINFTITRILTILLFILVLSFVIFQFVTQFNYYSGLIVYIFSIFTLVLLVVINAVTTRKKLLAFLSQENDQIWAFRGLYWQYVALRRAGYLELRVTPSANDYYPPGQSQPYFQGTIPNPYMQQQQAYTQTTPYIQQVNLTPQTQPVNYGQQPQYQPTYNQELQGYPTNTAYVQHTNFS